jgi:hypothetical protein
MAQTLAFPFLTPRALGAPAPLAFTAMQGNKTAAIPFINRAPSVRGFFADTTPAAPAPNAAPVPAISVQLFDTNNASAISTPTTILGSRRWQDSLDSLSQGKISMPYATAADISATSGMTLGRHLRFTLGTTLAWTGRIVSTQVVETDIKDSDKVFEVTCLDVRSILDRATVFPQNGLGKVPASDLRTFAWHSAEGSTTGWSPATFRSYAISIAWRTPNTQPEWFEPWLPPDGWPIGTTKPIQGFVGRIAASDVRTTLFKRTFTVASDGLYDLWLAMYSGGAVYVDGIQLYYSKDNTDSWRSPWRAMIELTAGDHVFAVELDHVAGPDNSALPGTLATVNREHCFALNLHKIESPETVLTGSTLVMASDDSWSALDNPAVIPNPTAGTVLITLIDEAIARGSLPAGFAVGFSATVDSDGLGWPALDVFTVRVGDTIWDVCQQLQNLGYEFGMRAAGLTLDVFAFGRGGTSAAGIEAGVNLQAVTRDERPPQPNTLVCTYSGGQFVSTDAAQVALFGIIEAAFQIADVRDLASAQAVATAQLELFAARTESLSVSAIYAGDAPYLNYRIGDTIVLYKGGAGAENVRLKTLDVSEDSNGFVGLSFELASASEQDADRIAQMLKRGVPGALAGLSKVATPSRWLADGGTSGLVQLYRVDGFSQGELVDYTEDPLRGQSTAEVFQRPVRLTYIKLSQLGTLTSAIEVIMLKNGAQLDVSMYIAAGEFTSTYLTMDHTFQANDQLSFRLVDKGAGGGQLQVQVWAAFASGEDVQPVGRLIWE